MSSMPSRIRVETERTALCQAWIGLAVQTLWCGLVEFMLRNARSDIRWSMRAVANLAAVDHGGQKALCSWGGPAVSDPAVLAAASICRPSADSHEASSIQLLIRGDERSRRSADRHARVKWKAADERARRCLHSVSHTNSSSSEQHVPLSNPSPTLSRLDRTSPHPPQQLSSIHYS